MRPRYSAIILIIFISLIGIKYHETDCIIDRSTRPPAACGDSAKYIFGFLLILFTWMIIQLLRLDYKQRNSLIDKVENTDDKDKGR